MKSFNQLKALYESAKDKSKGKPIGNNLRVVKYGDAYGIKLHNTVIVTVYQDNSMSVTSGGWKTITTKKRINEYLPIGYTLIQRKHAWIMVCNGVERDFEDNMGITPSHYELSQF